MKPVIHASRRGFMTALGGAASAAALMGQQSESARTWRVGVIGRTGHGDYGHGLDVVWKKFPNARIVAVADDNPEGLKKAAERLGVRSTYSDYRQMLRQERPDVVSIAPRWADSHHDMVLAAAEAGASIYIEKPLARTPAEADRMIAGCDRAHVKLAVAHQMRISPLLDLARQRLAEGIIGQLLELRGRGKEDARGGGEDLMVLGTHTFDLMRQFAGDPLWASGSVTSAGHEMRREDIHEGAEGLGLMAGDSVAGTYGFRDGITGYFASKKSDEVSGGRWGLTLLGSLGVMAIRAGQPLIYVCSSPQWNDAPWTPLLPGGPRPASHEPLVADLLEAIQQDREPLASGRQARWTLEMVMALYESQLSGGRVAFPLKNRNNPLAG